MQHGKLLLSPSPERPELEKLVQETLSTPMTDQELLEQRISFAYGNAPVDAVNITKESLRIATQSTRITR